jgi:5-methylcytosine-specific restriction endonuclease McrA
MTEISNLTVLNYYQASSNDALDATRAILLFGKNAATYKFALLKTLMDLEPSSSLEYSDIGETFVRHLVEHHRICPNQHQRKQPTELARQMTSFIADETDWQTLLNTAEKSIYNNVFDALQNIGNGTIAKEHRLIEHDKENRRIILTSNLNRIQESDSLRSLVSQESEARWRVVEEAWRSEVSPLMVFDPRDNSFFTSVRDHRINLRSAVATIGPYQKGRCFYCGKPWDERADAQQHDFPEVDHFIPLSLLARQPFMNVNPNGVWNLVIACKDCNRGQHGKSDQVPSNTYFERLLKRNEYYTEEHKHSMRYSILKSLGVSEGITKTQQTRVLTSVHQELYSSFDYLAKWAPRSLHWLEEQL